MHDRMAPDALEALQDLFESARELVRAWLEASGLPLFVTVDQLAVETRKDGSGWGATRRQVEANVLANVPRLEIKPALELWAPRAHDLASKLEAEFRESLPPLSPFSIGGAGLIDDKWTDPNEAGVVGRVLSQFVVAPTSWYLRHLDSVATGRPDTALELASEVLAILRTGECIIRQSVPLEGLKLTHDVAHGSSRIRALSPVERGELVEPHLPSTSSRYGALLTGGRMIAPAHELEVDTPTQDVQQFSMRPPPDLLVALALHQVPIVGPGVVLSRIVPDWYGLGTSGRPVPMRRAVTEGGQHEISQAQFDGACDTAERLKGFRIDDPQRTAELALRRFNLGCGRDDVADALVDFVIALEALLLPYDEKTRRSEMTYRFRMHGAHFISSIPLERRTLYDQLDDLYDIRSRLVHGGKYPRPDQIRAAERSARGLAARGLLKAVDEGFPDVTYFRRALLGDAAG